MLPIDFTQVIDQAHAGRFRPGWAECPSDVYSGTDGALFRSRIGEHRFTEEIVRISDAAYLFASDGPATGENEHHQIISDSDWLHVQFRLEGGGRECVSQRDAFETPRNACIISRYPRNSLIERVNDASHWWKVACLLISPKGMRDLLDISEAGFPEHARWMAEEGDLDFRLGTLLLHSQMSLAINDILLCPYTGDLRRAYMRAKSIELLSSVIHGMGEAAEPVNHTLKLSKADLASLATAHRLMTENLEGSLTLAELARHVGLNRTKLALGFKRVYGTSVQAFWRDAKLDRARESLRDGRLRVTEVALNAGYSEISSFSRAFTRKFGILPRDCRSSFS